MTLNQLQTLTEDELCLCLFIVNVTFPTKNIEYDSNNLTWIRHDMLIKKLSDAFPRLKEEAHPIFVSLMEKLGIQVEIKKQEPALPPPSENISGSVSGSI